MQDARSVRNLRLQSDTEISPPTCDFLLEDCPQVMPSEQSCVLELRNQEN